MQLYIPSYQHQVNFNITLSYFLHKTYKSYNEKNHTLEGDLILAKNYFPTLDHISHFSFEKYMKHQNCLSFFYSILLLGTHHKTQSYTDMKFLMKEGITDCFFCSAVEQKQCNRGFKPFPSQ